jgi:chemotaxis protein methyltransferase CheR
LEFTKKVSDAIGIALDESKEYLLDSRLTPIAKINGYSSYITFIEYLNSKPTGTLHWQAFEALLTNETMFFRDEHFFIGLKEVIIPRLIEKNKALKKIRIWCASVSTGQEAYSLAFLIKEYFPELQSWNIEIQASDICQDALAKSSAGTYSYIELKRGLTEAQIKKYFHLNSAGVHVVDSAFKDMIRFSKINLVESFHHLNTFDLILIRNVMIYFSPVTKQLVLKKVYEKLHDGDSFLMLGAAESLIGNSYFTMYRVGKFSFYKKKL